MAEALADFISSNLGSEKKAEQKLMVLVALMLGRESVAATESVPRLLRQESSPSSSSHSSAQAISSTLFFLRPFSPGMAFDRL